MKAYVVLNHNLKLQCKKFSRTRDIPNFPTQGWAGTAFCTREQSETYVITNVFYWSYSIKLQYISFFNIPPLLSIMVCKYSTRFLPHFIDIWPTLKLLWDDLRFLWFSMDFHSSLMKMRLWQLPPYTLNEYVFSDLSAYGSIFWTFRRVTMQSPSLQSWSSHHTEKPFIKSFDHPGTPTLRHVQTYSTLTSMYGASPSPRWPHPEHIQTCSLYIPYCRQVGDLYWTEILSC